MHPSLAGLTVLERGWLSSNNVLIHAAPGELGAVLVDTSHVNHVEQTHALVSHALRGEALSCIVNTHLHSDHCGGNAALRQAFGATVLVPPGLAGPVRDWDTTRLNHDDAGQHCARFTADGELAADVGLVAGGRRWEVLPAPGHDPDSVMLFDRAQGVLISADALWQEGLGVVFPELVGGSGFAEAAAVLEVIARLPVQVVIPGHGAPFADVAGALHRARQRLARQRADPARHARHALKVLVKYHLMEVQRQSRADFAAWAAATPLVAAVWQRHGRALASSPEAWAEVVLSELVASGALALAGDDIVDIAR